MSLLRDDGVNPHYRDASKWKLESLSQNDREEKSNLKSTNEERTVLSHPEAMLTLTPVGGNTR